MGVDLERRETGQGGKGFLKRRWERGKSDVLDALYYDIPRKGVER
jgi:hypothetical protein